MKRFWHSWLAVTAAVVMISPAVAQTDMNGMSEIGSYQSILSRAGYQQNGAQATGAVNGSVQNGTMQPTHPAMPAPIGAQGMVVDGTAVTGGDMSMGMVGGSGCGGAVMNGGMVGGGYADYGYDAPVYGGDCGGGDCGVGSSGRFFDGGAGLGGRMSGLGGRLGGGGDNCGGGGNNYVVGLGVLFLKRDYEDNRLLSVNGNGDQLFTNDTDHGNLTGYEASITSRGSNGSGWQAVYWGIPSEDTSAAVGLPKPITTQIRGFDQVSFGPSTVYDIYNLGDVHTITRSSEIHNFELNMLRNAGRYCSRRGNNGTYEFLGGFRYLNFDEQFVYRTDYPGIAAPAPETVIYSSEVENQLFGFQVGGRRELCLTDRTSFGLGTKVGVFNNRVRTQQSIVDGNGTYATINQGFSTGRDLNYSDTKNDVAFLGELDASLIFCVSQNSRFRVGYRAMGVSGVGLATDQIPHDFSDSTALQSANSNGDLMMHGGYFGLEYAY